MLNKYLMIGHLGRDPEVRYTAGGTSVASFSIASTRYWTDKATGEKREDTFWMYCTAFSKLADSISRLRDSGRMVKGARVCIEGYLTTNKWTQADGTERERTVCMLDNYYVVDRSSKDDSGEAPARQAAPRQPAQKQPSAGGFDGMDDEIPF